MSTENQTPVSAPSAKLALCTPLASLPVEYRDATVACMMHADMSFLQGPFALIDRAECETDPSQQQIIPYVLLINPKAEVFCYSRGGSSGEGRLVGNLSVGLGGHVDELPAEGESIVELLDREATREILEETGLPQVDLRLISVLRDPTNAVGQVHMGLLIVRNLRDGEVIQPEANVIEKGEFVSVDYLKQPEVYERLENWSKVVVNWLSQVMPEIEEEIQVQTA